MRTRIQFWWLMQAVLTAGLVALIVALAHNVLLQVDRASEDKALTLTRTVVAAIKGVIRHGPDQEGRVQGILEQVSQSRDVLGVGIVRSDGTPLVELGVLPADPELLTKGKALIARDGNLSAAISFDVGAGCLSAGTCRCAAGTCPCGSDDAWAVPGGAYTLVLSMDRGAARSIQWPIFGVAALGVLILLALLLVAGLLVRSIGARERLARDMALEQQRRQGLESLGMVAAGLAHEIRNPLGAIRGLAQLLHEQSTEPDDQKKFALMMSELDRVSERLEEFLGFARKRKTATDAVDLTAVARKTVLLLGPDAQANRLQLSVVADDQPPVSVKGDTAQLEELLLNLVLNAVEASTAGGKIVVEVSRAHGMPSVTVTDNGHGILSEDLPLLFDPYFTTKTRGSGLGLALSRRIAEEHHALLTLENGPYGGAIARLEFIGETGAIP